jgi:lantibiotic modifying enzyme
MRKRSRSRPAAGSALALVARPHRWPSSRTYPGIANGWQGAAWVAFKLADAGVAVPDRVFASVGERLAVELDRAPHTQHVGSFIGCAASAVIAAYAARHGAVRRAVARAACKRVLSAARESAAWDLHMGLGGALLALAEIAAVEAGALRDVPPRPLVARLLSTVDRLCALPPRGWQTGMAHGPAGAMVALEACGAAGWCRITTARRQRWLDALAASAMVGSNGALFWPSIAGQRELKLQSWCSGTPGIALALLECFRLSREAAYLDPARGALEAMKVLSNKVFFSDTLCCGSAGHRHIFLEAYRVTGERQWLEQASSREARVSRSGTPRPRRGLLQGELGIAYLAERVARPHAYPFPGLGASSATVARRWA